ncbi:MAG: hypothetical protein WBK18_10890, partial [Thermacetogeniaceae bacterium]
NVVHKRSSPFGWFVLVHSILPKVMISCLFLLVFSYKNFTLCFSEILLSPPGEYSGWYWLFSDILPLVGI